MAVAGLGVAAFGYLAYTAAQWLGTGSIIGDIKNTYDEFREAGIDKSESVGLTAASIVNPDAVETIQSRLNEGESKRVQTINAINAFYDRAIQTHLDVLNGGGLTPNQEAYQRRKITELEERRQQRIKETNEYFNSYKNKVNSQIGLKDNNSPLPEPLFVKLLRGLGF